MEHVELLFKAGDLVSGEVDCVFRGQTLNFFHQRGAVERCGCLACFGLDFCYIRSHSFLVGELCCCCSEVIDDSCLLVCNEVVLSIFVGGCFGCCLIFTQFHSDSVGWFEVAVRGIHRGADASAVPNIF